MNKTNITWTDFTWNPITGCTAVSEGCKNCYAKSVHERFYDYPFDEILLHVDRLEEPLKKRKKCRVFVGSMTDLFHDDVPFEWLDEIFHVMMRAHWLTFQILTKRPERMKEYISSLLDDGWNGAEYQSRLSATKMMPLLSSTEVGGVRNAFKLMEWHGRDFTSDAQEFIFNEFPNIIFGVTTENQVQANERIPYLLDMPVGRRFISIEPMLSEINLENISGWTKLDWIIVGGESGAKSKVRKMEPSWAEKMYFTCLENGVSFFFKQWGSHKPNGLYKFENIREFPKNARV